MKLWEKWFWASYIRGENPILAFATGIVRGFSIPLVVSAVFCLFTDPQFRHIHSFSEFSISAYGAYYVFFWKSVLEAVIHFTKEYLLFAYYHWDEVVAFVRRVLWLD